MLKRFPRLSETFILNEILELERQGVEVEVFSLMQPPQEARHALLRQLRGKVFYLPTSRSLSRFTLDFGGAVDADTQPLAALCDSLAGDLQTLFAGKSAEAMTLLWMQAAALALLTASRGIDHLHAHFGSNAALVALLASRQNEIPFSYTAHARDIYHTYVDPEVDDQRRRLIIREAAFVVTVSDFNLRHLRHLAYRCDRGRIQRLYNGIDMKRFQPALQHRASNRFIAVGRLVEKKGYPVLIEACRLLADEHPGFRLTIVGDGPQQQALESQIAEAGLQQRVTLFGACTQERVIELMHDATALVLPCVVAASGDRDGLPTALLEAMAMGLPCISTEVAGIPEIIDADKTGLLVAPENPKALASAIGHLLRNPARQAEMGLAGRRKAVELFNLCTNVAELQRYFRRSAPVTLLEDKQNVHRLHGC